MINRRLIDLLLLIGNVLVAFELLPNIPQALTVNRRGQVKISLSFQTALAHPVVAVVYCDFQSVLEIDRERNVTLDR